MITNMSSMYLTNRDWFRNTLKGEEVVLCFTSALECLEMFVGYVKENQIDVYAKRKGVFDNINYRIISDFERIETVKIGNLVCTSFNQTVNDMFSDFDNIDEQSLVEAISCYYFNNNNSFNGLDIEPINVEKFNSIKDWAIEYYTGG